MDAATPPATGRGTGHVRPHEESNGTALTPAASFHARTEAELRASEERLRLAVAATGLAVFDWDLTTDLVTVNARFREMFALPPGDDVIGAAMLGGVVHPEDQAFVEAKLGEAFDPSSSGAYQFEHRALTPNGEVWLLTFGQVYFAGEEGEQRAVRVIGNDLDISERKRAEAEREATLRALEVANAELQDQALELELTNQQLQDNAAELEAINEELQSATEELTERSTSAEQAAARTALLQSLTDALSRAVTSEDVASVVVDRMAAALGAHLAVLALVTPDAELLAVAAAERLHEEIWREWATVPLTAPVPLAEAAHEGRTVALPTFGDIEAKAPAVAEMCRAHGTSALCAIPVRATDGQVLGALGLSFSSPREFPSDELSILETLSQQAAQALERARLFEAAQSARADAEAAEARLRHVFEQAPVAVAVLTGPEHVYTVVSPRYAKSPGNGKPLLGRSVRDVFPELEDTGLPETMDRVYATGEPYFAAERQVFLVNPESAVKEEHYFNVGYQPLRDAAGQVYAIASVAYDITEQVRARREVEAARAEAERQRTEAEAANAAKSQFLSTMSHELRTPLNAIAGYTQLLTMGLRGPLTESQRQDMERIERASQHLMALVTDVLNFARIDAGQIEFHLADIELATVIGDVEPLIRPQLAAKGLTFDHDGCAPDTPDQPHRVRADAEKVRQILLNLLSNAVKFTDAGGRVSLACETDRAAALVRARVSDTGRGIPSDQLERIFEPFVQVDRHRTHDSQQGVGLGLAISRDLARGMGGDLAVESEEGRGSTFTLVLRASDSM